MKNKNAEHPILTISLLSSNRQDTIRRCLDSVTRLRERVPSELVIIDTSQDKEMRKILREYTDRIYPFTWCNDFSKARNTAIEHARGEWFLYLDDDEWFVDTKDIEEFFLSGEYKGYGLAVYYQKNYFDKKGRSFEEIRVSRIFPLAGGVHFESSIHEYPSPIRGERKILESRVEHYGYAFETEEERIKHFHRNVSLLEDMMKRDAENPRWWLQMIQEYRNLKDYALVLKYCKEGILLLVDRETAEAGISRGPFYVGAVDACFQLGDYEQADKLFDRAVSDRRNSRMCLAALYRLKICVAFEKKEYAKCGEYSSQYLHIYKELKKEEEEQEYFYVNEAFMPHNLYRVYNIMIKCGLMENKTRDLYAYFDCLGWNEARLYADEGLLVSILGAFGRLPFEERLVEIGDKMMARPGIDVFIMEYLEEKRQSGKADEYEKILNVFAKGRTACPYIVYRKKEAQKEPADYRELKESIGKFCDRTLSFYKRFYEDADVDGAEEDLSPEIRIALRLQAVLDAQEQGEVKAVGEALKAAIGVLPPLDEMIREYTNLYAEQKKRELAEKEAADGVKGPEASAELRQLGMAVKGKIRMFMEQGLLTEAMRTLNQLKTLMPGDLELEQMEKEIKDSVP